MAAATLRNDEQDAQCIEWAIEVFVGGFTFTPSLTHPYLSERIGPLWVMRDGPRRHGDYRNEEWIAHDMAPPEADRLVRRHARGRFAICVIGPTGKDDRPLREQYKALGVPAWDDRATDGS